MEEPSLQSQVEIATSGVRLPAGVALRAWQTADFPAIQRLSELEGWPTPSQRPAQALQAWQNSWPALVATDQERVIAFLRAISDGAVTTYVAEVLVAAGWHGLGLGTALLAVCHRLLPTTRLDLLSIGPADGFYRANGFRPFQGFRSSYG
jgi:GNAT superfamily N-acetyltransferase